LLGLFTVIVFRQVLATAAAAACEDVKDDKMRAARPATVPRVWTAG